MGLKNVGLSRLRLSGRAVKPPAKPQAASFFASSPEVGAITTPFFVKLFSDLRHRCVTPEVMDQPGLDAAEHARALRGLSRINTVSGSAGILWPSLRDLARAAGADGIRVLDIATGAGDVPLRLWQKARRAGVGMRIAGCGR